MTFRPIPKRKEPTDFLKIGEDLVVEWREIPYLLYVWGRRANRAKKALRSAKTELKRIRVKTRDSIRRRPARFGIPEGSKLTSTFLDTVCDRVEAVISASQAVDDLEYEADSMQGVVYCILAKRDALRDIVKLSLGGYHSEPTAQEEDAITNIDRSRERRIRGK